MGNAIMLEGVSKSYSGFTLNNLSFCVPEGSIVGLVGVNGAGKSTTIKLILNLIRREAGSIQVLGLDNRRQEQQIKRQIGVVFDECLFHPILSPLQVGKMLRGCCPDWDDDAYAGWLKRFGLPEKKQVKSLSRGMRMKLSLAAALSHHPKLLILDEPTSGLDPVVRDEVLDLFLSFIEDGEHSILLSTHITSDLDKIADYITFLNNGTIQFEKSKDDILYQYGILKAGKGEPIDQGDFLRVRTSAFGVEALTDNRQAISRKYPGLVVDSVTIEDVIVFLAGKERFRENTPLS